MRVAVVFPGQGSQVVGMGADLAGDPAVAPLYGRVNAIVGDDLVGLMRDGPESRLRETQFSQPAIFLVNYALFAAVGPALRPVASAGHSFGEFCSLTAAGALSFETALALVAERGRAMQAAAERAPGAMAAVLGLAAEPLRGAVAAAASSGRVRLANFNAPGQIVISGDAAAVERAGECALAAGAKRVIPLNVSGAWHSELMEPARERFAPYVDRAPISLPSFPVISNVDAEPYADVASIRANLVRSVTDEVRWHDTALRMLSVGVDLVIEFGASAVLAPLVKRLPGAPRVLHAGDRRGVAAVRAELAATVPS